MPCRVSSGRRAPEDTFQNQSPSQEDLEAADRAQRVVTNDIENLWPGLIVTWAAVICIAAAKPGSTTDNQVGAGADGDCAAVRGR